MSRYKKRKLLVKPEIYLEPHQKSQTAPFPKNSQQLKPVKTNFAKNSILNAQLGSEYIPIKSSV